jgi:hypothetical protein
VIVGAPRSGTNMLRDALTKLPGTGSWPCDEIPYVWRYGHARVPHDAFTADMATEPVRRYVRGAFRRLARRQGLTTVVEKTCANSLRVAFVDRILPEARYVVIVRDGLDAAVSAMRRWTAPLDLGYTVAKARFVPLRDLPTYGARFVTTRLARLRTAERRVGTWGPVYPGMRDDLARRPLDEVCALQWAACVDRADGALEGLDPARIVRVRYEALVAAPREELRRIATVLGADVDTRLEEALAADVRGSSVGKGRATLDPADRARLAELVAPTLARHGYPLR